MGNLRAGVIKKPAHGGHRVSRRSIPLTGKRCARGPVCGGNHRKARDSDLAQLGQKKYPISAGMVISEEFLGMPNLTLNTVRVNSTFNVPFARAYQVSCRGF